MKALESWAKEIDENVCHLFFITNEQLSFESPIILTLDYFSNHLISQKPELLNEAYSLSLTTFFNQSFGVHLLQTHLNKNWMMKIQQMKSSLKKTAFISYRLSPSEIKAIEKEISPITSYHYQ